MKVKHSLHAALSVPISSGDISVLLMCGIVTLAWSLLGADPDLYNKIAIATWLTSTVSGAYLVLSGKAL